MALTPLVAGSTRRDSESGGLGRGSEPGPAWALLNLSPGEWDVQPGQEGQPVGTLRSQPRPDPYLVPSTGSI